MKARPSAFQPAIKAAINNRDLMISGEPYCYFFDCNPFRNYFKVVA